MMVMVGIGDDDCNGDGDDDAPGGDNYGGGTTV